MRTASSFVDLPVDRYSLASFPRERVVLRLLSQNEPSPFELTLCGGAGRDTESGGVQWRRDYRGQPAPFPLEQQQWRAHPAALASLAVELNPAGLLLTA